MIECEPWNQNIATPRIKSHKITKLGEKDKLIPEEVAPHPVGVVHEVSPALVEQGLHEEPRPDPGLQSLGSVVQQGPDVPRVLDRLDGHGGVELLLYTKITL